MPSGPPAPDTPAKRVRTRRIYDAAQASDGKRILVDRLWPRGMTKDRARLFLWCRDIAPSADLRRWFHANTGEWDTFCTRYLSELAAKDDLARQLAGYAQGDIVTLLYASRDEGRNNATVLRDYLRHRLDREKTAT